jgi:PAS domain S-box-containing protein
MRSNKNVLYSFVNTQTKLLKCNQPFLTALGASSLSEIIGKELKDVFHIFNTEKLHHAVRSCLAHPEQKITIDIEILQGGIQHHFEWIIYAEKKDDKIQGVHLIGRNADMKKQAQQKLIHQATLLSFMEEAVIAIDKEGSVTCWNKAAETLFATLANKAIGTRIQQMSIYDQLKPDLNAIKQSLIRTYSWKGHIHYQKNQTTSILDTSITALRNEENTINGFVAVIRKKEAPISLPYPVNLEHPQLFKEAHQLYSNRALFEMIVEHAPLEAWVTDENGIIQYMNPRYRSSFNCGSDDSGKSIFELFPKEMAETCWKSTHAAIEENRIIESIEKGFKKDGSQGMFRIFKFPLLFGDKKMAGGWCIDVTEQLNLQEQLLLQEKTKQSEIIKSIIETQEKERRDLSIELHDNVNQILSSCKLMLEVAQEDREHMGILIERASQSLQTAIAEIRKISHDLNPSTIEDIGIVEAINELIEKMHLTGKIIIHFTHEGFNQAFDLISEDKIAIYRVVQEQLNNILKHADALKVSIYLKLDFPFVSLRIEDDGKGFDIKKAKRGLGLKNIYHRVEYYRGKMELDTAEGAGCKLDILLNLTRQ